ncbi:hypothetical protein [Leifsonia aquatica]|uniref:hypothetical protein n=1 Tax=Leifsonia aquatica TaxID=144185 RepID=UPI0037FC5809
MSSGKIALDFDVLEFQASRVDQIGSDIGVAASAVRSMNLGGGAFGVLCGFLVAPALLVTTVAGTMIGDCEELMQRTGAQLRKAATDAQDRERDIARTLKSIEAGIG